MGKFHDWVMANKVPVLIVLGIIFVTLIAIILLPESFW